MSRLYTDITSTVDYFLTDFPVTVIENGDN